MIQMQCMASDVNILLALLYRQSNNAIHLSRLRQEIFLAERTLRPGDGKR